MVPLYLLVLPITIAEYVYYEASDPHRGVKIFGFVMAALCGAALIGYVCWVIVRRHRRSQPVLPPPVAFNVSSPDTVPLHFVSIRYQTASGLGSTLVILGTSVCYMDTER